MEGNGFLKTYELSTEILHLISKAESYCYIVTPYIKVWPQLDRVLDHASKRNLFITFIIREDKGSGELIKKLNGEYGFEVIVIKDIHIKLYLNEQRCILSTMNLYDASQQNNLELGYIVPNPAKVKRDILEGYILLDKSAQTFQGKFENDRKVRLTKVSEAKKELDKDGHCVVCNSQIESDFNPYSPYKVRCRDCYSATRHEDELIIKFCHYCGEKHESTLEKPFHYDCTQVLKSFKREVRPYVA